MTSLTAIDLFAGLGGATAGATAAGIPVTWAANHWSVAVDAHRRNHPQTTHSCQDLHQADWSQVPRHDILLASPACTGHARARGKERPHHDASRSTAWAVVSCLEAHRTDLALVENVVEFRNWILYPSWAAALQRLGYHLTELIIDAADCGVPQNRIRLFIIASRRSRRSVTLPKLPHRPAREIIDWSLPVTRSVRTLCPNTRARVRAGRKQHGDTFLIPYYSASKTGRSLDRPLGTVTTKERYALVVGDRTRMLSAHEYRAAMGFAPSYWLPPNKTLAVHLLGNAVCPPVETQLLQALCN